MSDENDYLAIQLINRDGVVNYYPDFFCKNESQRLFDYFHHSILWQHDKVKMFGKVIETKRKTAWYGAKPFEYKYSGLVKQAILWDEFLMDIKNQITQLTSCAYNSCLLNYYENGSEGMSWHSDNERAMRNSKSIASISLGATRKFSFKHKQTGETYDLSLENGSLLDMRQPLQQFWKHQLPISKKIGQPRINLTFRWFDDSVS